MVRKRSNGFGCCFCDLSSVFAFRWISYCFSVHTMGWLWEFFFFFAYFFYFYDGRSYDNM
jgi:hypothetical protein